jgi:hypothetical protein
VYIVIYNPYDDYYHRDESWEVYDTTTFHNYTKEGFEDFIRELDGWNVRNVYEKKEDMPEYLLQMRLDVTWHTWDSEDGWNEVVHDKEEMYNRCNHRWLDPSRDTDSAFGGWYRKCKLCGKREHTNKTRDEVRKTPVF